MCGRYTLTDPEAIRLRFTLEPMTETRIVPRFNIAPTQEVLAIYERYGERILKEMRWGFQPAYARESMKRPPPINARAEGLVDSPLFRRALERGRCLIPADGFFEWKSIPGLKRKQPYFIGRRDRAPFAFAGLWTPPRDDHPATCVIVTTVPNDLVASIHNRMPVILSPEDEALWLDREVRAPEVLVPLLRPYPAEEMIAFAVGSTVSDPKNDAPDIIDPVEGMRGLEFS